MADKTKTGISDTQKLMLRDKLREARAYEQAIKKRNPGPIYSIEDKFKKAGLEDEYQSGYGELASFGHNNISALQFRHLKDGHLRMAKPLDRTTLNAVATRATSTYIRAVERLPTVADTNKVLIHKSTQRAWQLAADMTQKLSVPLRVRRGVAPSRA